MADWLSTGASLLGAYLGSKGNDTKTTSTNAIDSRMGDYIYGNGSTTQGVLPAATDWYQKNQSGLNDQSLQGLNRQWNTASDPATAQGYTNMQGLGSSLMGGGVAGNPFTTGRASLGGGANLGLSGPPAQPMAQPQFHNPATMGNPAMGGTSGPFTQPTNTWHPQTPQAALTNWAQGPTNWNGGNGGNGSNTPGDPGDGSGLAGLMNSIGLNNPGWGTVGGVFGGLLGGTPGSILGQLIGLQSQGSNDASGSLNGMGLLGANMGNMSGYSNAGSNGWGGTDGLSQALGSSAFGTGMGYGGSSGMATGGSTQAGRTNDRGGYGSSSDGGDD